MLLHRVIAVTSALAGRGTLRNALQVLDQRLHMIMTAELDLHI
jgi:hypothetical protein